MKKLLSGTTAIVAAGVLAGGAQAADPISIGVGGYFNAGVSVVSQDQDQNLRSYGVEREAEIIFSGSTTLDNGLDVGVTVQLEAETSGDQIDESFAWIGGSFGQLRVGSYDGALNVMGVYAPSAGHRMYGVLFPVTTSVVGGGSVGEGAFGLGPDYDAAKITWYSPTVGGARIGVSFTPEPGDDAANGARGTAGTAASPATVLPVQDATGAATGGEVTLPDAVAAASEQSEVLAIGGNWSGDFGGASVSVGAGYAAASIENPQAGETDQKEWIVGLVATMDAVSVGGNYSEDNNGQQGSNDRRTWALGATHSSGPVSYGVTYTLTTREQGTNPDRDSSAVSLGASYGLGGGTTLSGEIQFWDVEDAANNNATVGLVGLSVRF